MILRKLELRDEQAFKRAVDEFKQQEPHWQFAFHFDATKPFSDYVALVEAWSRGEKLSGGFVPNTFLVAEVDGAIVGRVSIRHELNDFLMYETGGHIGYGVVPSCRRKGFATQMLSQALQFAKELGLSRVLLTTDHSNSGSIKTIERNGGVQELARDPKVRSDALRYWIDLLS